MKRPRLPTNRESSSIHQFNKELFSWLAPNYDQVVNRLSFRQDARWKAELVGSIPPLTAPRCLDLGCGTGGFLVALSGRFPEAMLVGADLTQSMIITARSARKIGRWLPTVQNAEALAFPSEVFDVVTCGYLLRNTADLNAVICEIARVLKPGGWLVTLDFLQSESPMASRFKQLVFSSWGRLIGATQLGDQGAFESIGWTLGHLPSPGKMDELLHDAGLTPVKKWKFLMGVTGGSIARREG